MKLGQKIILSLLVMVLLAIIIIQGVVNKQKNLIKEYVINEAQHFQFTWKALVADDLKSLEGYIGLIECDESLKTVFLERNKEKLYSYAYSLFQDLQDKHNIDNLSFILPDGHYFLELDDILAAGGKVSSPFTVLDDNKQLAVSGIVFENDGIFLKVVKPYYKDNTLIGYLEITLKCKSVINNVHGIVGENIILAVKKALIREDEIKRIEALHYEQSGVEKFDKFLIVSNPLPKGYSKLLNKGLENTMLSSFNGLRVMNAVLKTGDRRFAFCSFGLKNIDGENIGVVSGFLNITPYLLIVYKVKFFSLMMILLLCVVVSIVGLVMMRSILYPIEKLTLATEQVGKGNLDVVFQDSSQDEIGLLGKAFNKMVKALKSTTTSITALNQEIVERRKIENALRIEKNRARRYFEISGVMFRALNDKGEITLVNKKCCQVLEASEDEIIGKNWFETFTPKENNIYKIFKLFMSGEAENLEYYENYIITAKGNKRFISWHNSILKDENQKAIGSFSAGQDITERVKIEQDLKKSEENYKNLAKELEQGQAATLNILEDLQDAKSTLEISRENFLNIVEKSTDSILIVDSKGIVKFANNSATVLFGNTAAELVGKPFGPEIKDEVYETKIEHSSGSFKIAEIRAVNTRWEEQTMTLVMLHDMTERKNAENSLRIAAHEWRVTFDSIGHGLSLLDLDGRVVRCNKSLSDFVDKPYAEILGMDCHDLIYGQETSGNCPIHNTLNTKQRSTLVLKKDDKWLALSVDPLLNEENELIGLIHSVTDMTDQKNIEQKLRKYTDYVENIIETAQAIIIGFDKNLNIQSINSFAEDLLGESRDNIIGHNWLPVLIPEKYRDELMQILNNCLEGDRVKGYEIPVLAKDNKEIMISWDSAELRDDQNKITGIVVMGYDVSQRKEVEKVQRLAQLGTLVSHMAHEVNNPLMVISGRAQLSLMEEIDNVEVKANLDIVMKECQRAKEIIQRLLRFSRPSKGEFKQTDVNASLIELVNLIEHQFGLNNVFIKKDYAPDLPPVMVDEKQIHEVFMNLLTNAQDAINGEEGTIMIKTQIEGRFVKITFSDSGEGITKEVLDKIFDPFFTTKKKGTGLGLSICYSIIKAHNGNLSFESVAGKGTTAVIILPYMQENKDASDISS